ncbi:unnamed protein product [Lepidochelys kempii]
MGLGQTAGPASTLGHAPGAGASASPGRGTPPPPRRLSAPRCCGAATKRAGNCREECVSEWGREVKQNSPAPCPPPGPAPGLRAWLWQKGGVMPPHLCSCLHALSLASSGRPGGPGPGCGGGHVSKPCGQEVCRQVTAAERMRGGGRRESQPSGPARMAGCPQAPPLGQGLARSPGAERSPGVDPSAMGSLSREPAAHCLANKMGEEPTLA